MAAFEEFVHVEHSSALSFEQSARKLCGVNPVRTRALNRSFAYSPCCSKRVCERPLHRSRLDGRSLPCHELPSRNLGGAIDDSDFAIAIAHADDSPTNRGKAWPRPRDNIIFELGLFMGRLGRSRAILMEPRAEKVRLPSDFAGVTTITYGFEKGADVATYLAPACNQLREHISTLGPNNG
ncbi:MAG TPA: TIR domain-containing protein [Roseiarcus sp.]